MPKGEIILIEIAYHSFTLQYTMGLPVLSCPVDSIVAHKNSIALTLWNRGLHIRV